jgi:hypothetical protein
MPLPGVERRIFCSTVRSLVMTPNKLFRLHLLLNTSLHFRYVVMYWVKENYFTQNLWQLIRVIHCVHILHTIVPKLIMVVNYYDDDYYYHYYFHRTMEKSNWSTSVIVVVSSSSISSIISSSNGSINSSSKKGKAIPLQDWTGPESSRRLRLPDFKTIGTWRW